MSVEQRVPLHVGRVLHQEPDWPELAYLTLTMPTGGLVQGDRVEVSVTVQPGASAHVTSQSATRAYRCEAGDIRQTLRLEVQRNGYLEWWPDTLIPYAGTALHQETTLVLEPGATLLFADTLLAGRIARGESHAYRSLDFTTLARRPNGQALFRDRLRLGPARREPRALGLLGRTDALGTFYLLGDGVAAALETPLSETLVAHWPAAAGLTRLPNGAGLLVRALTERAEGLRAIQALVLSIARRTLRGQGVAASPKF